MSNFKITLNEALKLKETIQDKLTRYQFILKNENSVPSGRKRNYDLKQIVKDEEDLRQHMIALKLLMQEANLSIQKGETYSIQYYVFLLSERTRQMNNLKAMPTDEGPLILTKNSSNITVKFTCIFNDTKKKEWLEEFNKECREISDKLTKLNDTTTITVLFDPSKI